MAGKLSLLGPRQKVDRKTAWGFLTVNMALPGVGSLMSGRKVGFPQLIIAVIGITATTVFGIQFIYWALKNWSRLHDINADPVDNLIELWMHLRWAALGMGVFILAWLWALGSSMGILRESTRPAAH